MHFEREVTVVVGENGSGKTRIYKKLKDISAKKSGAPSLLEKIFIDSLALRHLPQHSRKFMETIPLSLSNKYFKKINAKHFKENFTLSFNEFGTLGIDRGTGWIDTSPGFNDAMAAELSIWLALRNSANMHLPLVADISIGAFEPAAQKNIFELLKSETKQLIFFASQFSIDGLGYKPDYQINYNSASNTSSIKLCTSDMSEAVS